MKRYSLTIVLVLCSLLTACGPNVFYIPIDNKLGNAKPLSKTEDTIRVVVSQKLTQYIAKARANGPGWLDEAQKAHYIINGKIDTEEMLQGLGYHVVDVGFDPKNDGHPNAIAMIDSEVLKTYEKDIIWQTPMSTDPNTGAPTMWQTDGKTVTMHIIYYKVKIVRPIGKDNPLFRCNSSSLSGNFCVYSDNPSNYETIFEGYGTMDTNAQVSAYILDHLTASVFYQYPNLLGKKRIHQISQPYFTVTKVTDAPADKK